MSAQSLTSRAIIGNFYRRLEQATGAQWVGPVSMLFDSDQDGETYNWLGMSPAMREWVGGRQAAGFVENGLTISNKHYEATIEVLVREMRRDKTGQVMARVRELADRTNSHWASLLSTLILAGPTTACYDGQFFYDTDHSEGSSGAQSNDITVDISTLPVAVAGTITNPSIEEAQQVAMKGIAQIMSFVDDRAEPINEGAGSFLVMTPTSLYIPFVNALRTPREASQNVQLVPPNLTIDVVMNPRLTWTDSIAVFRTDGSVKPFIRQQETNVALKVKAEGSEYEFDNDAHQYGVDSWRNVGYGYWQHSCFVVML